MIVQLEGCSDSKAFIRAGGEAFQGLAAQRYARTAAAAAAAAAAVAAAAAAAAAAQQRHVNPQFNYTAGRDVSRVAVQSHTATVHQLGVLRAAAAATAQPRTA